MSSFSPSYRGKPGTWCRDCFSAYNRGESRWKPHDPLVCTHCGQQYIPRQLKPGAAFCSRECKEAARKAAGKAARLAAKAAATRLCPQCGEPLPPIMRTDAAFCSDRCNQLAHRVNTQIRKGRHPDGVTVTSLGDRDGWRCGMCRQPIDPALRHPDPLSGSIDHIVPVSEGGGDDPSNLRLVHLVDNLRRGNVGGGEQLAIFG
jgi:endogenous inhibitor of DNA gyrase (YacG/DUF329 family)